MKKALDIIILTVMLIALMVGSADPMPGTPMVTVFITELVCLIILVAGAIYLRGSFNRNV